MENTFIRDERSKAIINTDVAGLQAYKAKKKQQQTVKDLQNEVKSLKDDISDIKLLLTQICNNR